MPRRCAIAGCRSKSGHVEHRGVTYHSFPFDSKAREIWLTNCKIPLDKNITKSVLVCSRHFKRADFQPIKGNKYIIKPGSYPSIFPWGKIESLAQSTQVKTKNKTISGESSNQKMEISKATNIIGGDLIELNSSVKLTDEAKPTTSKRPSSDTNEQQIGSKPLKMAKDEELSTVVSKTVSPRKSENVSFVPGARLEAQDFDGAWHNVKVVEVDNEEREVLIKFEKPDKPTNNIKVNNGAEEWIPMNSSRLRSCVEKIINKTSFIIGEKCMARWAGSRKFPASIAKVLENDMYEVLFEDGFEKILKSSHISKIKTKSSNVSAAQSPGVTVSKSSSSSVNNPSTPTSAPIMSKSSKTTPSKRSWPLISRESLNLDELNLPHIPEDGEWCCHWVNDQPIGKEGFLMVGDHKKPTVIVDDWRLPPDWVKHMYQRSNVLGKWDVILVSPQLKRFRSKADLKQYIEEQGQVYNPDVYDFSIHRRRAKDINAYVFTKDYKPPQQPTKESAFAGISPAIIPESTPIAKTLNATLLAKNQEDIGITPPSKILSEDLPIATSLEDGYVHVGALKVQIIENLFRCPQEGCNKNFRKENHLQIHVKHYHRDLAKLLGVFPNMQELAWKRTVGTSHEEPLPKNHLPNSQFFAKVHQQDIQSRTHRKSQTPTTSTQTSPLSSTINQQQILDDFGESVVEKLISSDIEFPSSLSTIHPTGEDNQMGDNKVVSEIATTPVTPVTPVSTATNKSKKHFIKNSSSSKKTSATARKSNRQRTTKKYLTANLKNPSQVFDATFGNSSGISINDFEETRHSFNATPDKLPPIKKQKTVQSLVESADGNSQTTTSLIEQRSQSQSPKYINENGELIKIVRMRQEEIINCLCSYGEEDGLMVQCELCLCWQHGICNGFEKQSQVPDKYVCYICRNPQRGRTSLKYIHDQDWLYDGKLPVANYHATHPNIGERFEMLKKTHTLTGNLLEIKRFMHSLRTKINIAANKDHPKMYLWAKKWENSPIKDTEKDINVKDEIDGKENNESNVKKDLDKIAQPTIPTPEAAIDSTECQHRLFEHIKTQQLLVSDRLHNIEDHIDEIESMDNDAEQLNNPNTREILSLMIRDLEVMKNISKINAVPNMYHVF